MYIYIPYIYHTYIHIYIYRRKMMMEEKSKVVMPGERAARKAAGVV
jgi:hypothetical protein